MDVRSGALPLMELFILGTSYDIVPIFIPCLVAYASKADDPGIEPHYTLIWCCDVQPYMMPCMLMHVQMLRRETLGLIEGRVCAEYFFYY